jgi:hypothetical protein
MRRIVERAYVDRFGRARPACCFTVPAEIPLPLAARCSATSSAVKRAMLSGLGRPSWQRHGVPLAGARLPAEPCASFAS